MSWPCSSRHKPNLNLTLSPSERPSQVRRQGIARARAAPRALGHVRELLDISLFASVCYGTWRPEWFAAGVFHVCAKEFDKGVETLRFAEKLYFTITAIRYGRGRGKCRWQELITGCPSCFDATSAGADRNAFMCFKFELMEMQLVRAPQVVQLLLLTIRWRI